MMSARFWLCRILPKISGHGLGVVLTQGQCPVAFYSHILGPRNRLRSINENQLVAKMAPLFIGRKLVIRTDERSLKYLMEKKDVRAEYQHWVSKLIGFEFEIRYKLRTSSTCEGEVGLSTMV